MSRWVRSAVDQNRVLVGNNRAGWFAGIVWLFVVFSVHAGEQANSDFLYIFQHHPVQQDPSGRSDKLARVLASHQQRRPSVWARDLAALHELPVLEKLRAVQAKVNQRIVYRDDPDNIWQSPEESYRRGGDCEDYAIAKLLLLRESGFPEENLRVITLAPVLMNQVYHVILLALWQGQVYVLDSPNRTASGQVVTLEGYKDAARPVVWAGWSGGFTLQSRSLDGTPAVISRFSGVKAGTYGSMRRVSYRHYPSQEKLVRIAADLLIIHPWEPPLNPREIERLRILRLYFHDPTPQNAQAISRYEKGKLDEFRRMRQSL